MFLNDWELEFAVLPHSAYDALGDGGFAEDTNACALIKKYDKHATIYLQEELPEETDEGNLVHELCHLLTYNVYSLSDDLLEHIASVDLREHFRKRITQEIEISTNHITRVILHG